MKYKGLHWYTLYCKQLPIKMLFSNRKTTRDVKFYCKNSLSNTNKNQIFYIHFQGPLILLTNPLNSAYLRFSSEVMLSRGHGSPQLIARYSIPGFDRQMCRTDNAELKYPDTLLMRPRRKPIKPTNEWNLVFRC